MKLLEKLSNKLDTIKEADEFDFLNFTDDDFFALLNNPESEKELKKKEEQKAWDVAVQNIRKELSEFNPMWDGGSVKYFGDMALLFHASRKKRFVYASHGNVSALDNGMRIQIRFLANKLDGLVVDLKNVNDTTDDTPLLPIIEIDLDFNKSKDSIIRMYYKEKDAHNKFVRKNKAEVKTTFSSDLMLSPKFIKDLPNILKKPLEKVVKDFNSLSPKFGVQVDTRTFGKVTGGYYKEAVVKYHAR